MDQDQRGEQRFDIEGDHEMINHEKEISSIANKSTSEERMRAERDGAGDQTKITSRKYGV